MAQNNKKISTTHQQLANQMDTSRSVVSRVLKKLEGEKKLLLGRGFIEVITDDKR